MVLKRLSVLFDTPDIMCCVNGIDIVLKPETALTLCMISVNKRLNYYGCRSFSDVIGILIRKLNVVECPGN
jgi:hypothetical protein